MKEEERKQDEFDSIVTKLEKYKPKKPKYKNERLMLLENVKKVMVEESRLLMHLKIEIFHFTEIVKIAGLKTIMKTILEIIVFSSTTKSLID